MLSAVLVVADQRRSRTASTRDSFNSTSRLTLNSPRSRPDNEQRQFASNASCSWLMPLARRALRMRAPTERSNGGNA